ncbi:hypothetical protein JHK85_057559 [Glycine max]|nr:hypothetical protein JHK85_057559 [Glycine max]
MGPANFKALQRAHDSPSITARHGGGAIGLLEGIERALPWPLQLLVDRLHCYLNWYGISCDATDINLCGESEDPIFEKARRSGYMTGKLSPVICGINTLTTLVVADWKDIAGEIPACVTALPSLRILDLIGNKLFGEIPVNVDKLSHLTVLDLADNTLNGKIPTSITRLGSLKHVDLNNNQLCSEIPKDFGNLAMLSRMLLNRNQLTGCQGRRFTSSKAIEVLWENADYFIALNG